MIKKFPKNKNGNRLLSLDLKKKSTRCLCKVKNPEVLTHKPLRQREGEETGPDIELELTVHNLLSLTGLFF